MLHALIPILTTVAAPVAKQLISRAIGEDVAELANPVITAVAEKLDCQPTAANIAAQYDLTPQTVEQAFIDAEAENAQDWQGIIAEINATIRAEHNAKGLLTRIWRPLFGIMFTLVFAGLGSALVAAIYKSDNMAVAAVDMSGLITAMLGFGSAVLGVYVHSRSQEKRLGVG